MREAQDLAENCCGRLLAAAPTKMPARRTGNRDETARF